MPPPPWLLPGLAHAHDVLERAVVVGCRSRYCLIAYILRIKCKHSFIDFGPQVEFQSIVNNMLEDPLAVEPPPVSAQRRRAMMAAAADISLPLPVMVLLPTTGLMDAGSEDWEFS